MKRPADLTPRWARQWQNPDLREARLLEESAWPASLPIGRPTAADISSDWQETAATIRLWRELRIGSVLWESITFRATGAPVDLPVAWQIASPDEWIAAAGDRSVRAEYEMLRTILASADPLFHNALVRERSLWKNKTPAETLQAARLAMALSPGCVEGKPLRAVSLAGIDSKFFERHRPLIARLLDLRFDGEASRHGLETFLDAARENDPWLLLADLGQPRILPFPQLRVRGIDLATHGPGARDILIVENEACLHLLPKDLPGVMAILGTGNNLSWLAAPHFRETRIGYWGDLDTWGLTLLSRARGHAAHLTPLLMTHEVFETHSASAVAEKVLASCTSPVGLTSEETALYQHLLALPNGRLEQEFLPAARVHEAIHGWRAG
ncbi:DUF3322 domain-containing protein [Haloferula sargassicola]|uniref:DUF3322 and DUF2220 domain-containing protein n=1 Tax=Haloferula sargassicola TaxID=490096 RepID=A0ABP9UIH0_9BACT